MKRSNSHTTKNKIDRKKIMENINKVEDSETIIIDDRDDTDDRDGTNDLAKALDKGNKENNSSTKRNKKNIVLSFLKKHSIWISIASILISVIVWGVNLRNQLFNINESLKKIENIVINEIKDTDLNIKDYKNDILAEIKDIRKELHILKDDTSKNLTEIKTFLYVKKK